MKIERCKEMGVMFLLGLWICSYAAYGAGPDHNSYKSFEEIQQASGINTQGKQWNGCSNLDISGNPNLQDNLVIGGTYTVHELNSNLCRNGRMFYTRAFVVDLRDPCPFLRDAFPNNQNIFEKKNLDMGASTADKEINNDRGVNSRIVGGTYINCNIPEIVIADEFDKKAEQVVVGSNLDKVEIGKNMNFVSAYTTQA